MELMDNKDESQKKLLKNMLNPKNCLFTDLTNSALLL